MTLVSNLAARGGRFLTDADLRHQNNIFTILRWVLASAVIYSHAWDLTTGQTGHDPSVALLSMPVSQLAVMLFFTLSGFLVAGSLVKRGVVDFAYSRALRMIPGLWVMLVVTILLIWALFAHVSLVDFLGDRETQRYFWRNAVFLGHAYTLPGVFETHAYPGVINGSLWTLPWETRCYIVLALSGVVGLMATRRVFAALLLGYAIAHMIVPIDIVPFLEQPRRLAYSFFLGVALYQWRDHLWLSWPLAAGLMLVTFVVPAGEVKLLLSQTTFAYVALVSAFLVPQSLKRFANRLPDYSYGIYIYAFPIQQAIIALGFGAAFMANVVWSFMLVLPFAALSWHFIEKPALELKRAHGKRVAQAQ